MEDLLIDLKNGFLGSVEVTEGGEVILGDSGDEIVDLLCMYSQEVAIGNGLELSVEGHEYPVMVSEVDNRCNFQVQCSTTVLDESYIRKIFETESISVSDFYMYGSTMYFTLCTVSSIECLV